MSIADFISLEVIETYWTYLKVTEMSVLVGAWEQYSKKELIKLLFDDRNGFQADAFRLPIHGGQVF